MSTTRPLPGPTSSGILIHFIGDMHAGAASQWRFDAISTEFNRGALPTPTFHMQIGDNTENGLASEFVNYKNFRRRLPAAFYDTLGNHDLNGVTAAAWAATLGYESANYYRDFETFRMVVVAADQAAPTQLSLTTLAFLDAALGSTTLPCIVCTHYPLYNTVGGDTSLEYTSTAALMFVCTAARTTDSNDILAVLGNHSNVKLYLCGHTHSRLTVPGLVMPVRTGSATFAVINGSSPYYQGLDHASLNGGASDIVTSAFINWTQATAQATGSVDVRWRDHTGGQWLAPNGNPVLTVSGL